MSRRVRTFVCAMAVLLILGAVGQHAAFSQLIVGVYIADGLGGACVVQGGEFTYAVTYDHSGSGSPVHNLTIVSFLSPYSSFVSATDGGTYDSNDHTATWILAEVPGRTVGDVFLTVRVNDDLPSWTKLMNSVRLWTDETPMTQQVVHTMVCGAYGNPGVKVAVHVEPHADRTCGHGFPQIDHTMNIVTEIADLNVDVFPVFFALTEYKGFEYGLSWPGGAACIFTSCSDLEIGDIVNSGDGISQAWCLCQPGPVAVPGWGWIAAGSAGQVCVVPHSVPRELSVLDCQVNGILDHPDESFCAGIGGTQSDWPFDSPAGTETTTWGKVKTIFE